MERKRDDAFRNQDYESLKIIISDLKVVLEVGNDILKLKRELEFAVAREDFEQAIQIRNRLRALENQRDQYDALYETGRYESMIEMQRPSTAYMRRI
jgi:centrosomal protein CEP104